MSAPGATDEHPSTEVSAAIIRPRQGPTVRQFVVNVVEGPSAGATWRSAGTTCAIGSESSNDLALQDPTVSRYHCELTWTPDGPRIRDLDSRNGTFVRIQEQALLEPGDHVFVGRQLLRL